MRRAALAARTVLRDFALPQPAALSRAGEVPAAPSTRPEALRLSAGVRAAGGALFRADLRRERRQAAALCELRLARCGRRRAAEAPHRCTRAVTGARARQCR